MINFLRQSSSFAQSVIFTQKKLGEKLRTSGLGVKNVNNKWWSKYMGQIPLLQPEYEWVMPDEFPDLSGFKEISIDLETCDKNLLTNGSGWLFLFLIKSIFFTMLRMM